MYVFKFLLDVVYNLLNVKSFLFYTTFFLTTIQAARGLPQRRQEESREREVDSIRGSRGPDGRRSIEGRA